MTILMSKPARQERDIRRIGIALGFDFWIKPVGEDEYTVGPIRNVDTDHAEMVCDLFCRYGYVTELCGAGAALIRCPE